MTDLLNDDERRAWSAAYDELRGERAQHCPAVEQLASLLTDDLAPAERQALAGHVTACQVCSAAYRSMLELDSEARQLDAPGDLPSREAPRRAVGPLLAAAAAVLLAGLLLGPGRFGPTPATPEPTLLRAPEAAALTPAAGAVLGAAPTRLAWIAQAGAAGYRVRLLDHEARPVWESPTDGAQVDVPPPVSSSLEPGQYYWVVECHGPTATRRLGPFWFTLRAEPPAEPR